MPYASFFCRRGGFSLPTLDRQQYDLKRLHRDLRKAFETFKKDKQVRELLLAVQSIGGGMVEEKPEPNIRKQPLKREDLKLICFEYIWL